MGQSINNNATDNTTISSAQALLGAFLKGKSRLVVLTGAGLSVGSGIPTYRDEAGTWQRSEPIYHQAFISEHRTRQRYWLRSYFGWPLMSAADPTTGHHAIAALERDGVASLTVTQNVDGLHQRAGSQKVIDLHGRISEVICLDCQNITSRNAVQTRLDESLAPIDKLANPRIAPDGDADADERLIDAVSVPDCERCGGMLKPNVVFFGDNVNKPIVDAIYAAILDADGLLIVGSSLKVFSGYRFCRYAHKQKIPIASVNPGISRGDPLINVRIPTTANEAFASFA